MSVKLSVNQRLYHAKYLDSIRNCKSKSIGWWIRYDHYMKNEKNPHGKEVFNSCKKGMCPYCSRSMAYKKSLDVFTKIDYYEYVYMLTFSPPKEFWFYAIKYKKIRTLIMDSIKEVFDDYGVVVGAHYFGDKGDHGKLRLHFHMLLLTNNKYPSNSLKYVNSFSDYKSLLYNLIVDKLKNDGSFDYIRYKKRFGEGMFVLRVQDIRQIHKDKNDELKRHGIPAKKFNLMGICLYFNKYIAFGKVEMKRIEGYSKYFIWLKMNVITYAGNFRKGRKILTLRKLPDVKPKFYRGHVMVFKYNFYFKKNGLIPQDIDEYYEEAAKGETAMTNYLKGVAVT